MRIGIYDPYLDDLGGGEKYMMTLASCLSSNNEVFVFWNDSLVFKKLEERFSLDLSKIKLTRNIFAKETSLVNKLIETKKYDIIIVLSDGSIPTTLSKNTFLHIQQPLPKVPSNIFSRLKLMRIKGVFCNSKYTKRYIDKELGIDSLVLYPPVVLRPENIEKENTILHVGRFRAKNIGNEDYKKQGFMIDSFKQIVDSGLKDWKMVMAVGLGEDQKAEFEKLKFSAEGYPIEFMINKNNDELWQEYSKAKIYWHASGYGEDLDKHPELAEHFGISTVEAMGAGCVPVVFGAGGQMEIVENRESGFTWNSFDDLKNHTFELINDPELLKTLSVKAKKRADYFAGDRFCRQAREFILS